MGVEKWPTSQTDTVHDSLNLFDQAFHDLLIIEGGYANDPADAGGKTNYGITEHTARAHGYTGDMKALTQSIAKKIYKSTYWDGLQLDNIAARSPTIALELFDTGVNQGPVRAAEFLQRSLNALNNQSKLYNDLTVDSRIGPATLSALTAYLNRRGRLGERVMRQALDCLQGAFYIGLAERNASQERFLFGWLSTRLALND